MLKEILDTDASGVLDLCGLECVRGGRTLFTGLNRSIQAGELLRVQGANGTGKTSLLRMLCGLLAPTQGQVRWRGQAITGLREEFGRELVYLGHAAALKDDLSPQENLQAACVLAGRRVHRAETLRALRECGLHGHENIPVRRLSQGQRRRAALARLALSSSAGLWVLDEPFNALDTAATSWLEGLVRAQLRRGAVVVLTSHQSVALDDAPRQELAL
ncbi:MAG: cytochrome c biogenesis heme-transporting ATPase CcmA [Comamonadaceae bacterium]|nr:MAG: cytochrome c biogenesis heme-transporting ATPase CcmA [Comamonadaceae bacterium]